MYISYNEPGMKVKVFTRSGPRADGRNFAPIADIQLGFCSIAAVSQAVLTFSSLQSGE